MSGQNTSAEIVELNDARARLRAADLDPKNFLAVGPYLEAVRMQQNLSLAAVSERTHIKASYIEAIEQMAIDRLPNRAYGVGFVRSYADALGLEAEPVINRFKSEVGLIGPAKSAVEAKPHDGRAGAHAPPATAQPSADPPRLSLLAVLAVLAFIIWCGLSITKPREIATPLNLDGVPLQPATDGLAVVEPLAGPQSNGAERAEATPNASKTAEPADLAIIEAQVIERVEPVYPPECEAAAAAAEVVNIVFTITPDGAVVSERVSTSSNACFERAALNALKRWRFSPRTIAGAPRPAFEQQVTLSFDRPS
ncbi:MAG: TonB family protein [Parvularculaceae bacterium]